MTRARGKHAKATSSARLARMTEKYGDTLSPSGREWAGELEQAARVTRGRLRPAHRRGGEAA